MAWLRLDDGYDTNPKLLELTECQRWRWTRALIHAARHRTQGHVGQAVLRELGLGGSTTVKLVNIGLLEPVDNGDYLIHDWADYNPKDPGKADRQRRWRTKKDRLHVDADVDATGDDGDGRVDAATVYQPVSRAQARARVPSPTHKNTRAVTSTTDATREPFQPNSPDLELPDIVKTWP